ncbi:MAG: DNA internalization-related competence protein ComEC/Rec2 [Betaproteobacteria bacterium]|nr:DNA internalization-related competence protein ComEC/Rec2 [Betaproteobacteria bacterium]
MRLFVAFFAAGTAFLQQEAVLPDTRFLGLAVASALASRLCSSGLARALLVAVAGFVAGHDLAAWRAQERLADELPRAWEGRDIEIDGIVSGLPQPGERGTRFLFAPDRIATAGAAVPSRLSVMWYGSRGTGGGEILPPPDIRAGERWRLTVRLKRPRGLANPHGFDFEPWALERGIRATGYVRTAPSPIRLAEHAMGWPQSLHRLRGDIRESMRAGLGERRFAGVLVALAIGDQDAIATGDWEVFWRTGVGHLVSISGLHVTMFASLTFAIMAFLWVRIPGFALVVPARKAGAVAGVVAAAAYTLLAGFDVPAQRTFLMLAVAAGCLLADRLGSPSRVLAVAMLAVLLLDPWAVLSPGFWLSFGAVGAIFFAFALRAGRPGKVREAVTTQAAVTLALWPFLASLFGEVSLVSPLANAFAIPLVSLVIVPLTLAGALLPLPVLLVPAHALMELAMIPLEGLASLPWAVAENADPPMAAVACAVGGVLLLLGPRGIPLRMAGFALLLPLAFFRAPAPGTGEAWIDILDVGQGLAVVVRTATHALAYDAGPSWSADSDSGSRIVVPYLRGEGVRRLDGIVITHADDDHAGGAASVARSRAPTWMLSPLDEVDERHGLAPDSGPCTAGTRWDWDGVAFEVLHPSAEALRDRQRRENDRSCVIRVDAAAGSMLLTADIERLAESELLSRSRERLRADVLLVPHHGSRTSSTPEFIAAVSPDAALIAAGWRNRFRHPSPVVEARYRDRGIEILRTDLLGALRVELPGVAGQPIVLRSQAGERRRYWSERKARSAP